MRVLLVTACQQHLGQRSQTDLRMTGVSQKVRHRFVESEYGSSFGAVPFSRSLGL